MSAHEISKALEVWTLQTLLDISIVTGLVAFGLTLVQPYFASLRRRLTLRVSLEWWDVFSVLLVDVFLAFTVTVGFIILNPDIMADIKVAVPFVPLATVLFALALLLRLLHGGHTPGKPAFLRAVWLMFVANLVNIVGFSLIMEAPSGEYLELHPSSFWTFIKSHLRSNASPHGLELNQISFYIFFPILLVMFVYAFYRAVSHLQKQQGA